MSSVGGKFSVQFPLPGRVGLAPSQPLSAFSTSEVIDSNQKETPAEVTTEHENVLLIEHHVCVKLCTECVYALWAKKNETFLKVCNL